MIALAIILGYALMVWITALILGIWSWDDEMDEFEWVMAGFWPLTIVGAIAVALGSFFVWLWNKIPCSSRLASIMCKLCIVFKPFQIGTMIRKWIQRKKDEKILKDNKKEKSDGRESSKAD